MRGEPDRQRLGVPDGAAGMSIASSLQVQRIHGAGNRESNHCEFARPAKSSHWG